MLMLLASAFPPTVSTHAVSQATLGMRVCGWSVDAGPAYNSGGVLHCVIEILKLGTRGTILLAQSGGSSASLGPHRPPLPGPSWCTWSFFPPSVLPPRSFGGLGVDSAHLWLFASVPFTDMRCVAFSLFFPHCEFSACTFH